eukprot:2999353-Rhodomonas_salina.3
MTLIHIGACDCDLELGSEPGLGDDANGRRTAAPTPAPAPNSPFSALRIFESDYHRKPYNTSPKQHHSLASVSWKRGPIMMMVTIMLLLIIMLLLLMMMTMLGIMISSTGRGKRDWDLGDGASIGAILAQKRRHAQAAALLFRREPHLRKAK